MTNPGWFCRRTARVATDWIASLAMRAQAYEPRRFAMRGAELAFVGPEGATVAGRGRECLIQTVEQASPPGDGHASWPNRAISVAQRRLDRVIRRTVGSSGSGCWSSE